MKGLIASVLLLVAGTANAAIVATANGVITKGCGDCDSTGYLDIFGLGPNADLTGLAYSVEYFISDEALANPLFDFGRFDLYYNTKLGLVPPVVTVNGHSYKMLSDNVNEGPNVGLNADGTFGFFYQNENPIFLPQFQNAHALENDFLVGGTGGMTFISIINGSDFEPMPGPFKNTRFNGTVDSFSLKPAQVPEPSTLALFAVMLGGIALVRRRASA